MSRLSERIENFNKAYSIFSDAVVIHSESANVTQSQINGVLNIVIVNTYDGEQTFTVFIP